MEHLDALSHELVALSRQAAPWVVRVNGRRGPNATGVIWSADSVITSLRAVHRDSDIEVGLPDGSTVLARLSGTAPDHDLALLRLERSLEVEATPWTTQWTPGIVLGLARDRQGHLLSKFGLLPGEALVHRISPAPEFLGSPLIDLQGRFLGVHLLAGGPSVVSYSRLSDVVALLQQGKSLDPGFLGLGLHRVEQKSGVTCLAVKVEGPARRAGVQVGDLLQSFDGKPVQDPEEVRETLRTKTAGSVAELEILRDGEVINFSVTLAPRPCPPPQGGFPGMRHHLKKFIQRHLHHHGPPCGPPGEGPPFGGPPWAGRRRGGPWGRHPHDHHHPGPPHRDHSDEEGPELV